MEEEEEWDYNEPDAHSCAANADYYGICQVCGAIVHGTPADYDLHGYDPPDPCERYNPFTDEFEEIEDVDPYEY